jgi:hypothetical protein
VVLPGQGAGAALGHKASRRGFCLPPGQKVTCNAPPGTPHQDRPLLSTSGPPPPKPPAVSVDSRRDGAPPGAKLVRAAGWRGLGRSRPGGSAPDRSRRPRRRRRIALHVTARPTIAPWSPSWQRYEDALGRRRPALAKSPAAVPVHLPKSPAAMPRASLVKDLGPKK